MCPKRRQGETARRTKSGAAKSVAPKTDAPKPAASKAAAEAPDGRGERMPRRGRWSADETAYLRRHYGLRTEDEIARELGRTEKSVREMAVKVFDGSKRRGAWNADEIERLKEYLGASPSDVIARVLGRSAADVERQIEQLEQLRRTGRWSHDEVQRLRRIYGRRTDEDLALILGRSVESIRRQAARYALAKDKAFVRRLSGASSTRMPRWSEDELELLRQRYPTEPNLEIARSLSRSVKSVVSKAHHLGLRKDEERLKAMGRENVSRRYTKGS
jgi:hypothetical protein